MRFQKIHLFLVLYLIFCIPNQATERRKPLPIDELRDPKNPSFVPVPYPQTDDEVITDLKYFVRKTLAMKCSSSSPVFEKYMKSFIDGKGVVVGEILRITNKLAIRERNYIFLVRLKTDDDMWVADFNLDSSGLFLSDRYLDVDLNGRVAIDKRRLNTYSPYFDKKTLLNQFKEVIGHEPKKAEILSMQLVEGQSPIANPLHPACEMILADGRVFYFTFNPRAIYSVDISLDQKSANNFVASQAILQKIKNAQFIRKSEENGVLVLMKMWGEK